MRSGRRNALRPCRGRFARRSRSRCRRLKRLSGGPTPWRRARRRDGRSPAFDASEEDREHQDINGEDLFLKRVEVLLPEEKIETSKVFTYDCKNFDKDSGLCNDYENRPEICRNSTCIDPKSKVDVDEHHKNVTEQKFIKIIPMR